MRIADLFVDVIPEINQSLLLSNMRQALRVAEQRADPIKLKLALDTQGLNQSVNQAARRASGVEIKASLDLDVSQARSRINALGGNINGTLNVNIDEQRIADAIARAIQQGTQGAGGGGGGGGGPAGAGASFGEKFGLAAGAAIVSAVGIAAAGINEAIAREADTNKLVGQLGLSPADAKRAGKLAGDIYAQNYGESFGQVNDAVKAVAQNIGTDLNSTDFEGITEKVINLSTAFDQDLGSTTAAVGQLLKTGLAKNATEALDIITKGLQSGTDKSGDFLDTLNEYGTQFRKLGIDGQTATGLISQGLKAGARDGDLVADALKEFSIRAIDGSKTTTDAYQRLGLNAKQLTKDIAGGGPAAEKGLSTVLEKLRAIKDPAEKAAIATELFGTQAEDLGGALFALDPTNAVKTLGDVSGAADNLDKTLSSGAAASIETFKRAVQAGLIDAVNFAVPIVAKLAGFLKDNLLPAVKSVSKFVSDNSTIFLAFGTAIGTVVGIIAVYRGAVATISAVTKAYTAVQAALNFVMSANPIGLVVLAIAGLVAGLIVAYKHSETFRILVNKAFRSVLDAVDKMLGGVQNLFEALGHVPGFGWAKTAADKIAGARDRVKELGNSIDTLPSTKNITVKVNGTTNGINSAIATAAKQDRQDRRANGGYISGPGGPTDDKIPALLSNGEYVIKASSVSKYGSAFLSQINAGRYAAGGEVGINLSVPPRNIAELINTSIDKGVNTVRANIGNLGGDLPGGNGRISASNLIAIGRMLQKLGFRVTEHPAFGGVHGGHAKNSYHYRGRAIDVNYGPPGRSAIETRAINALLPRLAGTRFAEKLWQVKNHFDHLHLAMASGGFVKGSAANPHIRDAGGPLLPGYTFNGTGRNEMVVPHFATGGLVQSQEFINEARALKDLITSIKRILVPDGSYVRNAASALRSGGSAGLTASLDAAAERTRQLQYNRDLQDANLARQRAISDQRSAKSHADMVEATTRRLEAEKQIKQLQADEEMLREQRIVERLQTAYDRLNELVSEYVDLVKQRASIERRYAIDQIKLQQQLLASQQQVREEFSKTVAAAVAARAKTFQTDATSGYSKNAVTPVAALLENLKSQSTDLKEYTQGLASATAKGLSPEFLKTLGINGVEDLDRLKAILNANGSELLQLGQAFADRQISAAKAANSEQLNLVGDLGDAILGAVDDRNEKLFALEISYQNDLKALHEQYVSDVLDVQQQIANIGKDTGRSYAENVAIAMQAGIPGISAALAEVQSAISAAASYTPGGTSAPGGSPTTGIATTVPLPSRTLANDVLIMSTPVGQLTARQKQYAALYHLALGSLVPPINPPLPTRSQAVDGTISNHLISTLTPRQELYASLYKLPVVLRDKGGYLEPGMTLVKNATGKREAVLDATQTQWLKKAAQAAQPQQTDEAVRELIYEFRLLRVAYERSNAQMVTLKRTRAI